MAVIVGQLTLISIAAALLVETGSVVVLLTLAIFCIVVPSATVAFTVATSTKFAEAPFARVPTVQLGADHVPTEGVALTKVKPAGRMS